jgi:hypothetical protein
VARAVLVRPAVGEPCAPQARRYRFGVEGERQVNDFRRWWKTQAKGDFLGVAAETRVATGPIAVVYGLLAAAAAPVAPWGCPAAFGAVAVLFASYWTVGMRQPRLTKWERKALADRMNLRRLMDQTPHTGSRR